MPLTKEQLNIYRKFHSPRSKLPALITALLKEVYPDLSDFNTKTYALQLYYDLDNGSRSVSSITRFHCTRPEYADWYRQKVVEVIDTYQQETINKWARHMKGAEQ